MTEEWEMKITIPADELDEIYDLGIDVIEETMVGRTRWTIHYQVIFSYQGSNYKVIRHSPATEYQDCDSWGYQKQVECTEVIAVEETITVWQNKKDYDKRLVGRL